MYQLKTQQNNSSILAFLEKIEDDEKRADCFELIDIFSRVSGETAKMWGETMIGFGSYSYSSKGGYDAEYFLTGFAPRKANITLYIMTWFSQYEDILKDIGKYKKSGGSCFQIKKLADIDKKKLELLIAVSLQDMKQKYL